MKNTTPIKTLKKMDACTIAKAWVRRNKHMNWYQLWQACPRGDWMLWMIDEISSQYDEEGNLIQEKTDLELRARGLVAAVNCVRVYVDKIEANSHRMVVQRALDVCEYPGEGEYDYSETYKELDGVLIDHYWTSEAHHTAEAAQDCLDARSYLNDTEDGALEAVVTTLAQTYTNVFPKKEKDARLKTCATIIRKLMPWADVKKALVRKEKELGE